MITDKDAEEIRKVVRTNIDYAPSSSGGIKGAIREVFSSVSGHVSDELMTRFMIHADDIYRAFRENDGRVDEHNPSSFFKTVAWKKDPSNEYRLFAEFDKKLEALLAAAQLEMTPEIDEMIPRPKISEEKTKQIHLSAKVTPYASSLSDGILEASGKVIGSLRGYAEKDLLSQYERDTDEIYRTLKAFETKLDALLMAETPKGATATGGGGSAAAASTAKIPKEDTSKIGHTIKYYVSSQYGDLSKVALSLKGHMSDESIAQLISDIKDVTQSLKEFYDEKLKALLETAVSGPVTTVSVAAVGGGGAGAGASGGASAAAEAKESSTSPKL